MEAPELQTHAYPPSHWPKSQPTAPVPFRTWEAAWAAFVVDVAVDVAAVTG